jgi:hypothetical protein
VALGVVPRVIVIGDPEVLEARGLGLRGLGDKLSGAPLLARQEVPELQDGKYPSFKSAMSHRYPRTP